jgi:hypothetical protein
LDFFPGSQYAFSVSLNVAQGPTTHIAGDDMGDIAKLISASAWGLVAVMLAAGIPFAWRKLIAWLDARTQVALAEAVRRMIEE